MVLSKDLKIAICFGLIMGAILSVCSLSFAAETETIEPSIVSGIQIDARSDTFQNYSGASTGYFPVEPGYVYSFTNLSPSAGRNLAISSEIPTSGGSYTFLTTLGGGKTYTFQSSQFAYMYFDYSWTGSATITREPLTGMTGFVDNIAYSLSIGELSGVWTLVVPILAISVLLGLGFYLLKRLLNRIKRAKGGA